MLEQRGLLPKAVGPTRAAITSIEAQTCDDADPVSEAFDLICAFGVPGSPVPKARPRVISNGVTYTPAQTVDAEERIAQRFKVAYPHHVPTTARLKVRLSFCLKGVSGDADNFGKLALDALQGKAFMNDQQVDDVHLHVHRRCANPRTYIEIWARP